MRREFHVRFCEGLGVRFPRATRLVIVCEREDDAHRLMAVLPKRLGRFGLQLHPDKTHQVPFGRPRWRAKGKGRDDDQGGPGTFDFLGFTHQWARSRKGNWVVKQNTSKSRFNRAVKATADWCRRHRHLPVPDQHKILSHKLRGHFNYFGITGNSEALGRFRTAVGRLCGSGWIADHNDDTCHGLALRGCCGSTRCRPP